MPDNADMEWERFIQGLARHGWMIVALCLSAIGQGVGVTYLVDEEYSSSVLLLVRPQEKLSFTADRREQVLDIPLGANTPYEAPSNTFSEIILSRALAEEITRSLALHEITREPSDSYWKEQWERFKDEAKKLFRDAWDLARFGRLIHRDPFDTTVANVQNGLAVEATNKSYVFQIMATWNNPILARDIANAAAGAFIVYATRLSAGEAAEQSKFMGRRLVDAQRELRNARNALRLYKEEYDSVSFADEAAEKIRMVADLETSLVLTESELAGLEQRYAANAPEVVALRAEHQSLRASVQALKEELRQLPEKEQELARLELRIRTAEETYELLTREYEEARILATRNISDVQTIAPAVLSVKPDRPVKIFYAVASGFLALMMGIALAVLFEVMDLAYIRNVRDAEEALQVPVLATLPERRWGQRLTVERAFE
jgi:uncharacterized protein involved in exopolysaccharide biosynthesis